ncbi:MAG: hypothetical protein VB144_14330 [Clostridia bacterium]|nr:hypothetical protein [Clostridia bacterium]
MTIDPNLMEVHSCLVEDYAPLIDYRTWRVASICPSEHNRAENVRLAERHNETDEVFITMRGHALLFVSEGQEGLTVLHTIDMAPLTAYNVKRGVWHTCVLGRDSVVLIVENCDTSRENSAYIDLPPEMRQQILMASESGALEAAECREARR